MRLFMAVELSDAMKSSLAKVQRSLARFDSVVRWTGLEHMHLTLKFFGDVPDAQVPAICSATNRVAESVSAFEIALAGCGCFPPRGPVSVIWAGLEVAGRQLVDCHRDCEAAYAELTFEPERRPFVPHLTLGRMRERKRAEGLREAVATAKPAPVAQQVDALCVVQSVLTRKGPEHTIISRHPFGGTKQVSSIERTL